MDPSDGIAEAGSRTRCREEIARLAALPRGARVAALAQAARDALAPVPAGLERVHPGWLSDALAGEPSEVIVALVAGLSPGVRDVARALIAERGEVFDDTKALSMQPEALADLRRATFGHLHPMTTKMTTTIGATGGGSGVGTVGALLALSFRELVDEALRAGAETLGASLAGAPSEVLARAAAAIGEPWSQTVIAAAGRATGTADCERARALVASASGGWETRAVGESASGALARLGLAALAARLKDEPGDGLAQVAQRLPPALGRALLNPVAGAASR